MSQQKDKETIIVFFVPFAGEEIVLNLAQEICGRFRHCWPMLLFLLSNCLLLIQVKLTKAIQKPWKYYLF